MFVPFKSFKLKLLNFSRNDPKEIFFSHILKFVLRQTKVEQKEEADSHRLR